MKGVLVIWLCLCTAVMADEFNADMENTGVCTRAEPVIVREHDIYNIFAEPRQDIKGTRDRCTIRFKGDGGRKFKLFIRELHFKECRIFIKMYDGLPYADTLNTARYAFDCNTGMGNMYYSYFADIAISLEKPDSTSTGYKFYIRLATEDGPDIGDGTVPQSTTDTGMTAGVIVVLVVAGVLVIMVITAVVLYLMFAFRKKQEEKAILARSMSLLLPSAAGAVRGDSSTHSSVHSSIHGSVHSSIHGSVHSSIHGSVHSSKHSTYPAFRTTITEKNGHCNSIDTQSHDSEQVDGGRNGEVKLKPAIKNVKHEFDSMRRGLHKENYRKARDEEEQRYEESRRREHQRADQLSRAESSRGFGRANRAHKDDRLALTDENIKKSVREARNKGRSFNDRSSQKGSTRSSRTRNKSHSPSRSVGNYRESHADSDYSYERYDDDRHGDSSRNRTRSHGGRQRSSSTGSRPHRKRDYYDERDSYSDYDDRRRRHHHDSEDEHRSRRDSTGHRSGTQRSRSQSSGRRR